MTTLEVRTTAGLVRGLWRDASAAFLGIPFAEPPVGDLRFSAPVPHASWTGTLDATRHGATPQRQPLSKVTLIPEPSIPGASTLNVDVFTPAPGEPSAQLPVLVWIHGGGFVAGSPASPWYDGAAFNRDGVVTVNISYRLGFEGFGWIQDAPLNRGVLDWILALEWVRDNIRAFGGDPSRVTVGGQSAGGAAAVALLAIPQAQHLFHQVLSLSGPAGDIALTRAERLGRAVAAFGKVPPTVEGFSRLSEGRLYQLQKKAEARQDGLRPRGLVTILAAMMLRGLTWGPVVDGTLIPKPVQAALEEGAGADKSLMIGATDNEGTMVLAPLRFLLRWFRPVKALRKFGLKADVAAEYVRSHRDLGTAELLGQFATDAIFRRGVRQTAEAHQRTGSRAWLSRFSWQPPVATRAAHCIDVPFLFDCLNADRVSVLTGQAPPQALAEEIHRAAVDFITTGDPGWPEYAQPNHKVHVYDVPCRDIDDGYSDVDAITR